jgi:hypothetical protein
MEITDRHHGMLEQGGISGREVLYKTATLEELGISHNTDPCSMWNEHTTVENYLYHCVKPDKVLKAGHLIR